MYQYGDAIDHRVQTDSAVQPPSAAATKAQIAREVDVRNQAIERLRKMNFFHARACWEHRYRDPLAPYGLALLFAQPDTKRQDRYLVTAATRLFLKGPESADLIRILLDLERIVGEHTAQDPCYDIRALTNRQDEQMDSRHASYAGIGISSLDTHTGDWATACADADSESDIPGVIRILLTDGTNIICERRASHEYNAFQVASTHSLEARPGHGMYQWQRAEVTDLYADPAHAGVLQWADKLNQTLWQADNARIVAKQGQGGFGRRGRR